MNEKVRIGLIFGAVGLVVGGGAFYFFKIHQPNETRAGAQAEIAAWEERWTETRSCLFGPTPASSRVSEALAIRELSPDVWERGTCTRLVSQLSRGDAMDSGLPAVEEAWRVLDKAASKVATSFISHVDPGGEKPEDRTVDPLPAALDALDAAHASLRQTAGLPPLAAPTDGAGPLPPAVLVPLTHGTLAVTGLSDQRVTSSGGLFGFGQLASGEVQLRLVAGAAPIVARVGAGTQRGIPDATWGARAVPDGVQIGALDDTGQLAAPVTLPLPGAQVIAVVGSLADGVVVFGAGTQLVIARGKAGTFVPAPPIEVTSMAFATDPATGRTVLAWADATAKNAWLTLAPGALDTPAADLAVTGAPTMMCLDRDRAWIQTDSGSEPQLVSATPAALKPHELDGHRLVGCTADGALLRADDDPTTFKRCMDDCNQFTPTHYRSRTPLVVMAHGWASFEARGSVLAARHTTANRYYAVPSGFRPLLAMTDGTQIDVLGFTAAGLVIARVPPN